jgi:cytochrome b
MAASCKVSGNLFWLVAAYLDIHEYQPMKGTLIIHERGLILLYTVLFYCVVWGGGGRQECHAEFFMIF